MDVSRYVENLKSKLVNIDDKKKLLEEITKQLAPKEMEKKLLGEVFTPLDLVEEMLETLPKEVWNNPNLEWLEPGSGIGNFSICVFYRLMEGLKTTIPDSAKRERHIIENMLYMAEFNPANVHICESIFKAKKNGYKLNIYEGDFTKLNPSEDRKEKEVWPENWPKQFDIIFGNPPFSSSNIEQEKIKGGNNLWKIFLTISFNILKKNGYILYITPVNWRKPNHKLFELITSKQLIYLKMLNEKHVSSLFNISKDLDYYLIKNSNQTGSSTLINFQNDQEHEVVLDTLKFIPNFGYSIIKKCLNKTNVHNLLKVYGRDYSVQLNEINIKKEKISRTKNKIFKYCNLNKSNTNIVEYGYTKEPHQISDKIKVLFSSGRYIYPIIDNGQCGVTHNGNAIFCDNLKHCELIEKYFLSNIISYIISACKFGTFEIDPNILKYFPDITLDSIDTNNDLEIYKYFGLTTDEIIEIEKTLGSRARHHSTPEELSMFSTSKSYANVVKKKLVRVDKLKQTAGHSQSTSIKQQKTDKLQYILQNVHKIDIKYKMFEKKLIEFGVNIDHIPKLWNKYYIHKKN